jgi:hypothetical protein
MILDLGEHQDDEGRPPLGRSIGRRLEHRQHRLKL